MTGQVFEDLPTKLNLIQARYVAREARFQPELKTRQNESDARPLAHVTAFIRKEQLIYAEERRAPLQNRARLARKKRASHEQERAKVLKEEAARKSDADKNAKTNARYNKRAIISLKEMSSVSTRQPAPPPFVDDELMAEDGQAPSATESQRENCFLKTLGQIARGVKFHKLVSG